MRTRTKPVLALLVAGVILLLPGAGKGQSTDNITLVSTIAFSSSRDNTTVLPVVNGAEVYLMDPDGSNVRRLTTNLDMDIFPALSPDGKKISFESNRFRAPTDPLNVSDLFVMDSNSEQQTQLITRAGSSSWSPDSKNIVFHASASGTGLPINNQPGAATNDSDIFRLNIDDWIDGLQNAENLTDDLTMVDDDPDWSPDGQKIAFTRHSVTDPGPQYTTAEIWVMDADGSNKQQLTFNNYDERGPAWSPDGTKILYICPAPWLGSGTDFEVCVMNADGTNAVALTNNTAFEGTPNWSPDGSEIVFHRIVAGLNQIFVMNADGTNEHQLTFPPGHNLFANWGVCRARTHAAGRQDGHEVSQPSFARWSRS